MGKRIKACICLLGLSVVAQAGSIRPPPLSSRALSHPSDISIQVLPRRYTSPAPDQVARRRRRRDSIPSTTDGPAWDDHFLLSFYAHDSPITLSLKPAESLVHPNGIKTVHTHTDDEGNKIEDVSWLAREDVRAYEGVVSEAEDEQELEQWRREEEAGLRRSDPAGGENWARIVLLDSPDDEPRFQGSFARGGDIFTIHSTERYLRTREAIDPEPPLVYRRSQLSHPEMVIVRERDILTPREHIAELRRRGSLIPASLETEAASACGHDHLPFNLDPMHPVFNQADEQAVFHHPDIVSLAPTTPWLKNAFGMPGRDPASPSMSVRRHLKAKRAAYGYPPRSTLAKRQNDAQGSGNASSNFINSIGSTNGCPKQQMVLFIGVAADCTFTSQYSSLDVARTQLLTDFNSASTLYQSSFNISLGIVELNVQTGACPTTSSAVDPQNPWNVGCEEGGGPGLNLNDRLSVFSAWRGSKGGADGAGLWHLLTNCSSGSEVGVAWLGQLCKVSASTGSSGSTTSGTGVTAASTRSTWQVIAHEIGHSFGAIHDCTSGCSLTNSNPVCCPLSTSTCDAQANYIMSPVSVKSVSAFSPCSIGNICTSLASSLNATCLATPGASGNPKVISLQSCGNGILEEGEDCDPGTADDPCCNPRTCKFAAGAVCDPLNSLCCTSSCQIASAGTVCRPSVDSKCDKAEVCSGTNSTCPADEHVKDGTSCGDNSLACASGVCTSRSLQCQAAGASLGLRSACPTRASDTCSIACQDPTSVADCVVLEQSFRDGTPCGYAGTCKNSACVSGSALETAKSWYRQNLQISIPVTVVAAIIVILILAAIFRCCTRSRQKHQMAKVPPSARYSNNGAPPPSGGRLRTSRHGGQNLAIPNNDSRGSGASTQPFVQPPQPVMYNHPGQYGQQYGGGGYWRPDAPPVQQQQAWNGNYNTSYRG